VPPSQDAHWQKDDRPQKLKYSTHGNADDPEGKQQQPDQWIQHKRHQSQWPAQD
jgi:hypothetical protein